MLCCGFLFGLEAVRDVVREAAESFHLVHGDDGVGVASTSHEVLDGLLLRVAVRQASLVGRHFDVAVCEVSERDGWNRLQYLRIRNICLLLLKAVRPQEPDASGWCSWHG